MKEVYFDNSATSPLHPEVKKIIEENLDLFGNPSSHHRFGRRTREKIEAARGTIAKMMGAEPEEIIFTSGGSESNNLVLKGITCEGVTCRIKDVKLGKTVITTQIEHPSVFGTCKCLEHVGNNIIFAPVDSTGKVDPGFIKKAIDLNTSLISVMFANNEIGTIQPISEIAAIAHENKILFHTDAVQAFGKIPINVKKMNIDLLSISGHKINAPKGVGALYIRKGIKICPIIHGGHQEYERRAGTENTLGILALGKACEIWMQDNYKHSEHVKKLRDRLQTGITQKISDIRINGHPQDRLPGLLNVTFKYIEGESILLRLDREGIAVSTGSACSSGSLEPSHVLLAIGLPHEDAHGSIRFSIGYGNTEEDVDYVLEKLKTVIEDLRALSPLSPVNQL
ncbi:MAG: cysteine desulfurase NifS [Candidatus Schekmanbacteria bacterium RBG_13_48_7]|uniref:cysteine desulfurase n=1 Tax=Candidatus Schekmanbacteria bacterium RBG_13_48_7 TaxID=1817878 RepID=A0A1F7RT25_9BACT|nr:MAG: cysteine desulfurase NifS [Candidatus Schekmanbacteria bacterium RBG_13_48_7]